ncbi:MAG: hypothetical protein ACXABY_11755 [Candidatus Thorarchaeota archaeon]|jgi:hypothetical protein
MTFDEAKALRPGDKVYYRRYWWVDGTDSEGVVRQVSSCGQLLIDFKALGQWRGQASRIAGQIHIIKHYPHICPYCKASALIKTAIMYCSKSCKGARNERRATDSY